MSDILQFLSDFRGIPVEQWLGLIALAAIGLAFACVWVVHSVVIKGGAK